MNRALRYIAPNLITAAGLVFGMMAIADAFRGDYVSSAWWVIYAVLSDRIDGFVARALRGTSELGVQLDSFADFLAFGVAPAVLVYAMLGQATALPYHDGWGKVFLMVSCGLWLLAACFRLARYNITMPGPQPVRIFFGVPTTLAAGTLVIWLLVFFKYAPPDVPVAIGGEFREPHLFGGAITTPDAVWRYLPVAMLIGAYLMASTLRMPKLGLARSRAANAFIFTNVVIGYICGFARVFPDFCIWPPTMWLTVFLVWGQVSKTARNMKPPPIIPPVEPTPGQQPRRPEDDMLDEGEIDEDDDLAF